jgi:MSHA pilin protein MshA
MRKINKQAGFTLIELIMVIVILGVLSAFALPRFANLGDEARKASINALAGAIKAAANIAHAQQLANGGSGTDAVDLDGAAGLTMVAGYPTANAAGIGAAAQIQSADYTSSGDGALATSTIVYTISGTTAGSCQVSYTPTNTVVVVEPTC